MHAPTHARSTSGLTARRHRPARAVINREIPWSHRLVVALDGHARRAALREARRERERLDRRRSDPEPEPLFRRPSDAAGPRGRLVVFDESVLRHLWPSAAAEDPWTCSIICVFPRSCSPRKEVARQRSGTSKVVDGDGPRRGAATSARGWHLPVHGCAPRCARQADSARSRHCCVHARRGQRVSPCDERVALGCRDRAPL